MKLEELSMNDLIIPLEKRLELKDNIVKSYYVTLKDAYNNIAIIGLIVSLLASLILGYALVKSETFDNSTNAPIIIFILMVLGLLEYARRLNLIQFYNDRVHDKIFPDDANETTPTLKLSYVIFVIFFLIDSFGAYTFTMFKGIDSHDLTANYKAERLENLEHNNRLKALQDSFDKRVLIIENQCAKNPYNTRAIDRVTCKNKALNGSSRPTIKVVDSKLSSDYENLKNAYLNPFNWEIKNLIMFIVFVSVSFLLQYLGIAMLKRTHEEKYSMLKESDCLILRNTFQLRLDEYKETIRETLKVKENFAKAEQALLQYAEQRGEYNRLRDMSISLGINNDWLNSPKLPSDVKSTYIKRVKPQTQKPQTQKTETQKTETQTQQTEVEKSEDIIDADLDLSILQVDGIYEDVVKALWETVDFSIIANSETDKSRKLTPKKNLISKFNSTKDNKLNNVNVVVDAVYLVLLELDYIHKTPNKGYFAKIELDKVIAEIETIKDMVIEKLIN